MVALMNVCLFVLAVLSLILYVAIIALLIQRRNQKNFDSTFYKIFISLGLVDIFQLVNSYLTLRCPMFGLFPTFYSSDFAGWLAKYACFAVWYCIFGQFIGNLLMAVNRYIAFKYVSNNDTLWTPFVTRAACVAPWVLPIPFAFHCFFQDANYIAMFNKQNETTGYSLQLTAQAYQVNTVVGKSFVSIVTVITGILYTGAITNMRKLRNMQTMSGKKKIRAETRMLCCALIIFLTMCTYTAYQLLSLVIIYSGRMDLLLFLYDLWYIVADLFTLINPWSMILLSGSVRRALLKSVRWRKEDSSNPASSSLI